MRVLAIGVEGVLKVVHVFALMLVAAEQQQVDFRRISFIDALRWLQMAMPGDAVPALVVNPLHRSRLEPRVRKRRPKQSPHDKAPTPASKRAGAVSTYE